MVALIEGKLKANAGVKSVTIDGVVTVFDRQQLIDELAYWQKRVAREAGSRPVVSRVDLS